MPFVFFLLASCQYYEGEPTTSTRQTCGATDTECMLSHLQVRDRGNGELLELVSIPAGRIQSSQLAPGKGLPTVTNPITSTPILRFTNSFSLFQLPLTFTDPNGAKIGGCFHIRLRGQVPGPFGGFPVVAFRSEPDGKTSGTLQLELKLGFDPASDAAGFDIDLYPMSAVDPSKEAVDEALNGGKVAIGAPLTMAVEVGSTVTPPSGGDSGPSTCRSDSDCSGVGQRHCEPKNGARCGSDGLCHCCLALCSSSTGACSCTACDGNCSGDRMCASSTCVFKVGVLPAQ